MNIVDTHCHIHSSKYFKEGVEDVLTRAKEAGITKLMCVGTSVDESIQAVSFAKDKTHVYPTVGIHPHEAHTDMSRWEEFAALLEGNTGIVAIGECGLDYWYEHSDKQSQEKIFRLQIELALKYGLPMVFHIRNSRESHKEIMKGADVIGDAFTDFLRIMESYESMPKGVIHSFSTGQNELNAVLLAGFNVGVNGIATFSRDTAQISAFKNVPLDRMVLETDAPYLTPAPMRGEVNEPAKLVRIIEFLSELRSESKETIAKTTTVNAIKLFNL